MIRLLALLALATPLHAQEPMSAAEFDAYTRGKTFTYGAGSTPYGGEDYLDNRRVRWSFLDGDCREGYWYESEGKHICFLYEDRPDAPQCWLFTLENGRLAARFANDPSADTLYRIEESKKPLLCYGPKVGV